MDFRRQVELEAKGTVGYSEAENKVSFMTGVGVAISRMEEKYDKALKDLKTQLNYANNLGDTHKKDLTDLASIINRYSDNATV